MNTYKRNGSKTSEMRKLNFFLDNFPDLFWENLGKKHSSFSDSQSTTQIYARRRDINEISGNMFALSYTDASKVLSTTIAKQRKKLFGDILRNPNFKMSILKERIEKFLSKGAKCGDELYMNEHFYKTIVNDAVILNEPKYIELLIKCGAPLNNPSKNQMTPLEIAIVNNNYEICSMLLCYNCAQFQSRFSSHLIYAVYGTNNAEIQLLLLDYEQEFLLLSKMKCTIPEISWHNREPVLSVDLHPDFSTFYKLATGGGDSHVLIWQVNIEENGGLKQELISDLKRHQRSVNVVRWSPSGTYLASADDDANIIIWQLKTDNIPSLDGETNDKEVWNVFKILRGHKEDIYDLCWSPNSLKLLSGSIDNTAILWDMQKGKNDQIMTDHKGFVQGVAWDPKSQYIATISTDRICRIFDTNGKHVKARISKGTLPVPPEHSLFEKEVKYFHDDTFKSFFRRLSFSPDGSILIVPSGHIVPEDGKPMNCTYIFPVETNSPAAILPVEKQCSTVVKCCPLYFELREDGPEPYINLPYRILFAIGTDHDIVLYDTQQKAPFARFNNIHYTRLTDLTWSSDGLLLIASSTDGFCTLITFEPEELGVQYVKEESENEEIILSVSTLEDNTNNVKTAEVPLPKEKEVPLPKVKELPDKSVIKVLTPRRVKRPSVPEKNASILSFFKKANDQNKEQKKLNEINTNDNNKDDSYYEQMEIDEESTSNKQRQYSSSKAPQSKSTTVINTAKDPESVCEKMETTCSENDSKKTSKQVEIPYVRLEKMDVDKVKKPRRITPSRVS